MHVNRFHVNKLVAAGLRTDQRDQNGGKETTWEVTAFIPARGDGGLGQGGGSGRDRKG